MARFFKSEKIAIIRLEDDGCLLGYVIYMNNDKKGYITDEKEIKFIERYFNPTQCIEVTDLIPSYLSQLNDILYENE